MTHKRIRWYLVGLLVLLAALVACQPETETVEVTRVVTETQEVEVEVPVEVTRVVTEVQTETVVETRVVEVEVMEAELGSEERPIKVLFVPSVEVDALVASGDLLAQELEAATGHKYEVSIPTSYAATIEAMCASPDDTVGFIPALGYVLANSRCGVQVILASVRFGWPYYWSQIIVRDDSGIESLEDLEGKTWGAPSVTSTSGYLVPRSQLIDAGIEPGEIVETGGHTAAALAVATGDVDFATTFFSPPLLPAEMGRNWNPDTDDPEIWRDAGVPAEYDAERGRVYVGGEPEEGGYRVLDARAAAMETYPAIFEETRILQISDPIPNDTMAVGPDFPFNLAQQIAYAVIAYVNSDECRESTEVTLCSDASYNWTDAEPISDANFDATRLFIGALGMSDEDILGG